MNAIQQTGNIVIALGTGVVIAFIISMAKVFYSLTLVESLILIVVAGLLYCFLLVFIIYYQPLTITRQVIQRQPIVQAVNQNPAPVVQEVLKPMSQKKHLFTFVGSNARRVFHQRTCRLAKLIKKKYLEHSNQRAFFTSKKYVPCKMCIKRKK